MFGLDPDSPPIRPLFPLASLLAQGRCLVEPHGNLFLSRLLAIRYSVSSLLTIVSAWSVRAVQVDWEKLGFLKSRLIQEPSDRPLLKLSSSLRRPPPPICLIPVSLWGNKHSAEQTSMRSSRNCKKLMGTVNSLGATLTMASKHMMILSIVSMLLSEWPYGEDRDPEPDM